MEFDGVVRKLKGCRHHKTVLSKMDVTYPEYFYNCTYNFKEKHVKYLTKYWLILFVFLTTIALTDYEVRDRAFLTKMKTLSFSHMESA